MLHYEVLIGELLLTRQVGQFVTGFFISERGDFPTPQTDTEIQSGWHNKLLVTHHPHCYNVAPNNNWVSYVSCLLSIRQL